MSDTDRLRRSIALGLIDTERGRQELRKAEGRFEHTLADPDWTNLDARLTVLTEELGEVAIEVGILTGRRQVRNGGGTVDDLLKELVQLGACAVAWAEAILEEQRR